MTERPSIKAHGRQSRWNDARRSAKAIGKRNEASSKGGMQQKMRENLELSDERKRKAEGKSDLELRKTKPAE